MANPEQLDILRQGAEAWNQWRLSLEGSSKPHRSRTLAAKPDSVVVDLRGADLSQMDLRGARLEHAYLGEANLGGANLDRAVLDWSLLNHTVFRGASLRGSSLNGVYASFADFCGCTMDGATICNATLHIANFEGSNLRAADLRDSDLRDSNFEGVDLCDAKLHVAKFNRTRLRKANLKGATMAHTQLSGLDLSTVKGLEEVVHHRPSSLALDSISLSNGHLPEAFLRGVGVEDSVIDYLPSLFAPSAIQFFSCFVSYSHQQKAFARKLHDQLQAKGVRCWLDEHSLLPGDDIYDAVDEGIRVWDKVLLCCSEDSLSSWWVGDEIDKALEKERQLQATRGHKVLVIIPLDLDGFLFRWQDGRSATLKKRLAADFVGWENENGVFERGLEKVLDALRLDGRGRPPAPAPML